MPRRMGRDEEGEEEEQEPSRPITRPRATAHQPHSAVIGEAFSLVFLAELGDRTQFATIFLATGPAFTFAGLLAGALAGHALVTWLAVGAGKWIGGRISEQLLYRLSGGLFMAFGLFAFKRHWSERVSRVQAELADPSFGVSMTRRLTTSPQPLSPNGLRLPPLHAAVDGSGCRDDRAENAGLAPDRLGRSPLEAMESGVNLIAAIGAFWR